MRGTSDDLRREIGARLEGLDSEEGVEALLEDIVGAARADIDDGYLNQPADDVLAAVQSWAGLVSHVIGKYYAPASPFPMRGGLAGWSKKVANQLQRVTTALLPPLSAAARSLGASAWGISVQFPWGVGVSLEFT